VTTVDVVSGRVEGQVPAGRVLVFDREWVLTGDSVHVPAIEVAAGAESHAGPFTALAASAVGAAPGDAVKVMGVGAVAAEARRLLAAEARSSPDGEAPASVIDTTGDPERIRHAMQVVASMGSVVLAGEVIGRIYDLDLYADIHVRGLRLKGVPTQVGSEAPPGSGPVAGGQELRRGDRLDPAALFYVLLAT
jgi:hypothetical protein